jgi:hypothetical protein
VKRSIPGSLRVSSIARLESNRERLCYSARHKKAEYRASCQLTRLGRVLTELGCAAVEFDFYSGSGVG